MTGDTMPTVALELEGVARRYGEVRAVDHVDLTVGHGRTTALLGPSGCGKSTLLRLIAGLEPLDAGSIRLDDRDLTPVPTQRRGIGMVFQDYALFPHMNVEANIAFGLVEHGWSADDRRTRSAELLDAVGLTGLESRRPHELSGGQQQRVALARALAPRPSILLLDEPLSNLDRTLRDELTAELASLLANLEVGAVHVTHDQTEAFTLGDRVALMRAGRIMQEGTPESLLAAPRDAWVARFLGLRELLSDAQARGLGFSGPTLLRVERLRPDPQGRPFDVRQRRIVDSDIEFLLFAPEWGLSLRWRARPRELDVLPDVGDVLRLTVPDDAWTVLEVPA